LYSSDSIGDVLGYQPQDVVGKSCFEYFHPDETPFAKAVHGRGVHLDRAAMLSYCNLKRTDGVYVRCECVFTVVYSVIVACTSLYRYTEKSQGLFCAPTAKRSADTRTNVRGRAAVAPAIRRAFSTPERDPRYQMLAHLSPKFTTPRRPPGQSVNDHEPRAALILNRFTRTLSIMYATHALGEILGIQAEDAVGRSFYHCIAEDCLVDCIDAVERAKENDSIAYLRFRWRDPRRRDGEEGDDGVTPAPDGGDEDFAREGPASGSDHGTSEEGSESGSPDSRTGSTPQSSISSSVAPAPPAPPPLVADEAMEVEAVVSCTSDGLVVVLRKARAVGSLVTAAPWALPPRAAEPAKVAPSAAAQTEFMDSIRQVAVFAWSLRSINGDIMSHALPGRPLPDASERVGDFVKPGTTHWKRAREWDKMLAAREGDGQLGEGAAVAETETDKDGSESRENKRRAM